MEKLLEQTCNIWSEDSLRSICYPCTLAKDTFLYLQEIGYFKTTPPYSVERANLPSFLLIYTLSGEGILEIDGQKESLQSGLCMFINCKHHHRYYTKPGRKWEFLWAHFYGTDAFGYHRIFSQGNTYAVAIPQNSIEKLFWDMIDLQQNWSVIHEIIVNQTLVSLLTQLLLARGEAACAHDNLPEYIQKIAREIERNHTRPLSLEVFSNQFHISKFHLSRMFRYYIGMSFREYVIFVRLRHAKELLKYTVQAVAQIALDCGFNDVSYFIRLFRNKEGCTPLEYRKQWGNQNLTKINSL